MTLTRSHIKLTPEPKAKEGHTHTQTYLTYYANTYTTRASDTVRPCQTTLPHPTPTPGRHQLPPRITAPTPTTPPPPTLSAAPSTPKATPGRHGAPDLQPSSLPLANSDPTTSTTCDAARVNDQRFQRYQHCKVSPKLPVLLTDKPRRSPSGRQSALRVWTGGMNTGPRGHRGGPTASLRDPSPGEECGRGCCVSARLSAHPGAPRRPPRHPLSPVLARCTRVMLGSSGGRGCRAPYRIPYPHIIINTGPQSGTGHVPQ